MYPAVARRGPDQASRGGRSWRGNDRLGPYSWAWRRSVHSVDHARFAERTPVPQAHDDHRDGEAATAEFKIRIGPLAQLSARLRLPRADAREMLKALVVVGLTACGMCGPVLTLWVGTTFGLPFAGVISLSCAEIGLAAFIGWRGLANRTLEPPP